MERQEHGPSDGSRTVREQILLQSESATAHVRVEQATRPGEIHQSDVAQTGLRGNRRTWPRSRHFERHRAFRGLHRRLIRERRNRGATVRVGAADKAMSANSEILGSALPAGPRAGGECAPQKRVSGKKLFVWPPSTDALLWRIVRPVGMA